ncbi:hypothetical protein C7212DRAFT_218751 [Tuber magnatum]|uniref:Nephrocystin 3-like N-terminal domain-containing protein n=1 Tax=Tuber magnatum TaxID=42249 RepID=A0A317SH50_9PEZI|nr:hypothetical protein C7212DRAFT_218751 [Tuber magnatum]
MDCGNPITTGISSDINNKARIIGYTALPQRPDETRGEVLKWISPLELPDSHQDALQRRFEDVGTWLLQTNEFSDWAYGSADPILFCYGPGAGKACISSLVIDTLCSKADEQNFPMLYLYCDYATYKELSATDLIAELLKKVVAWLDRIPEEVSREFKKFKNYDRERPPPKDVSDKLCAVLAPFERAFICIDALDEFPIGQRPELLRFLKVLTTRQPSKIRLFLTGRPLVEREIELYLGKGAQIISFKPSEEDIKEYITQRLCRDPNPDEMNPRLRNDIMRILPHKVSGMYVDVVISCTGAALFADGL